MKSRPIIMSTESVRGIYAGNKTQTRRVIKGFPWLGEEGLELDWRAGLYDPIRIDRDGEMYPGAEVFGVYDDDGERGIECPFGKPGDRLWTREKWKIESWDRDGHEFTVGYADGETSPVIDLYYKVEEDVRERYRSQSVDDCRKAGWRIDENGMFWGDADPSPTRWRSPMIMPRWASRLTLEITGIRVERLQDISEEDAIAEGIKPFTDKNGTICFWLSPTKGKPAWSSAKAAYADTWDFINAKRGYSWESNPYVWAITFRRIEQ